MKNYYEILEVDKKASQEVIEKAYKTLAKKYHPDLQQGVKKEEYSEKMKILNQAYEVLENELKRAEYDEKMQNEEMREKEKINRQQYNQQQYNQQQYVQQQHSQPKANTNDSEETIVNVSRVLAEQLRAAQRQAYYDAYVQDLKSRGYKIKYKRDLKYYLKLIKVILIIICTAFLIYQIPFVKSYFHNLYNENVIFQAIIDIFKNTFSVKF